MVSIRFKICDKRSIKNSAWSRYVWSVPEQFLLWLQLCDRCPAPEKCQCFQNKITDIWEYLEIFIPALLGSGYLLAYLLSLGPVNTGAWPQHEDCLEAAPLIAFISSFEVTNNYCITILILLPTTPHQPRRLIISTLTHSLHTSSCAVLCIEGLHEVS